MLYLNKSTAVYCTWNIYNILELYSKWDQHFNIIVCLREAEFNDNVISSLSNIWYLGKLDQCSELPGERRPRRTAALAAAGSQVVLTMSSTEGFLSVQQLNQITEARHLPIQYAMNFIAEHKDGRSVLELLQQKS